MYFSEQETERRFSLLRDKMRDLDLEAVMFMTHGSGPSFQEEFWILQNDYLPAGHSITLVFVDQDPVTVSRSLQAYSHAERSTVKDNRVIPDSVNPAAVIVDVLKEKGVTKGKIGWRYSLVPVYWFTELVAELPAVEWVDMAGHFVELLNNKSAEEAAAAERSAALADAAYAHLIEVIEPGMTEFDVVAEFEHHTTRHGANRNFTLIASGRIARDAPFPELHPPSWRKLERGDSVMLELTPASSGYYTQLVRTIDVAEHNARADELRLVCVDALAAAAEVLRPGCSIGEVGRALMQGVTNAGYKPALPIGHTVGVSLVYERLLPTSDRVLHPNEALIIHPKVHTPDDRYAFFWGESYLVTDDGSRKLHQASTELHTA